MKIDHLQERRLSRYVIRRCKDKVFKIIFKELRGKKEGY